PGGAETSSGSPARCRMMRGSPHRPTREQGWIDLGEPNLLARDQKAGRSSADSHHHPRRMPCDCSAKRVVGFDFLIFQKKSCGSDLAPQQPGGPVACRLPLLLSSLANRPYLGTWEEGDNNQQ
ncbi:hypothetical protein T310_9074, partial [Rasamsonia emersonii CBS 393.64]